VLVAGFGCRYHKSLVDLPRLKGWGGAQGQQVTAPKTKTGPHKKHPRDSKSQAEVRLGAVFRTCRLVDSGLKMVHGPNSNPKNRPPQHLAKYLTVLSV